MYAFRFGSSDKLVYLTRPQLVSIPYLAILVTHKDDMSSIENENGEYVLNSPIDYEWFMPILHSITSDNPYTLFNELSEDNNILDTIQLFDYLCIKSFPWPLLKYENLMRSNSMNVEDSKINIIYHKASLTEARQSAAEFIIALSKNEYNLRDSHTIHRIFFLIKAILSEIAIFSSRFRYHTLVVTKECCYSFFSKKQRNLLPTTQQIAQHSKNESFMYLYDDNNPLSDEFNNAFSWRGVYMTRQDTQTNTLSINSESIFNSRDYDLSTIQNRIDVFPRIFVMESLFDWYLKYQRLSEELGM
jgi:hypothetical protein